MHLRTTILGFARLRLLAGLRGGARAPIAMPRAGRIERWLDQIRDAARFNVGAAREIAECPPDQGLRRHL
jgi:hypothetical protein